MAFWRTAVDWQRPNFGFEPYGLFWTDSILVIRLQQKAGIGGT
jgi:hypothetical protein